MAPRIVVVPPSHAEIAEIARKMAPAGFELVMSQRSTAPSSMPALATGRIHGLLSERGDATTRSIKAAPKLKLYQLLSAGYDDVDIEAARRAKVPVCNNGGANAISVSEHAMMLMLTVSRRVLWQHDNVSAGRWRGNGAGADDVRDLRQDARHRRPRHHRQEGRAARQRVRHAGAVLRHRAAAGARGGRARRRASACCASCCAPPTSSPCMCRSTIRPAT